MNGLYIVIGILIVSFLLVLYMLISPKLRHYRISFKRVGDQKKKRRAKAPKKKKSVWIRIL